MRLFLTLALALLPGLAWAAPDGRNIVLHGNGNGALPCAACHGANGAGKPAMGAPALAGMPASTIIAALNSFAASQGDGMMPPIARALSPDERAAVAAYFAGLPHP